MTDRELLELVEEGMKVNATDSPEYIVCAALRARLARLESEPVAVFRREILGRGQIFWLRSSDELPNKTPLYTASSKKEWVGLTDKEIEDCLEMSIQGTCRAIEAKLKEKNSG